MNEKKKSLRSLIDIQEDLQNKAALINDSIRALALDVNELIKSVEAHAIKYNHKPTDVVILRKRGKDAIVILKDKKEVVPSFCSVVVPTIIDTSKEVRYL